MGDDTSTRLTALAREVERANRRVGELEDLIQTLAGDLTRLAEGGTAGNGPDTGGAVRAWLLTDEPELAREDLLDLVEWLDRVYLKYPDVGLSTCWLWHPDVVEELLWLRGAHADAYTGKSASWTKAGDWHDRLRPGAVKRIKQVLDSCELGLHVKTDRRVAQPQPTAPMTEYLTEIANAHTTTGRPPRPTDQQLKEAEEIYRAELRTPSR